MRYILFIYIRWNTHRLKKPTPQASLAPQGSKRFLCLNSPCTLNRYEFMVHYVPIYRKNLTDFNEEKNLEYFSFYNLFVAYEAKVKRRLSMVH